MKNKLLKTLACFAGMSAIGSTIAIASTSCGSSSEVTPSDILPDNVYNIKDNVLRGFTNEFLANPSAYSECNTMLIPASVSSVNDYAFIDVSAITTTIPDFIKNLTFADESNCSSIGGFAFLSSSSLTSINLSNCSNLTTIGNSAFTGCSTLTSIIFPSSLEEIGGLTFYKCSALDSVDLSKCVNLSTIEQSAFDSCSSLTSIIFPSSLATIKAGAFNECFNLNDIEWNTWADNTTIGRDSFSGVCPDGGTVTVTNPTDGRDSDKLLQYLLENGGLSLAWAKTKPLPESVYNIDQNNVLQGFTSEFLANPSAYSEYDTMEIPANVTSIANKAFYSNSASTIPSFITKLTFADESNCSSIGGQAFSSCKSLIFAAFPTGLTTISGKAFEYCSALTSISSFPSSLTTIGSAAFYSCSALTSVYFFKVTNLTEINQCAFGNCSSLTSVTFPAGLITIGDNAFSKSSSLTSVTLTSSITTIEWDAFYNCSKLNDIKWDLPNNYQTQITFGESVFSNISSTGTVKSLNSSIASSEELLAYLKTKGLPDGWRSAEF